MYLIIHNRTPIQSAIATGENCIFIPRAREIIGRTNCNRGLTKIYILQTFQRNCIAYFMAIRMLDGFKLPFR